MCKVCEHKISRKSPITISGYLTDTNSSTTLYYSGTIITSDLTKCQIGFYNEETDRYEMVEWKFCPVCGKQL